jgi:hypothetical protein
MLRGAGVKLRALEGWIVPALTWNASFEGI